MKIIIGKIEIGCGVGRKGVGGFSVRSAPLSHASRHDRPPPRPHDNAGELLAVCGV
jgi:hypothetical protein